MGIKIQTARNVTPMIYAYTTPGVTYHEGWIKIGYTERDVDKRIKEQLGTARIAYNLEWKGNAIYDDGTGETFDDKPFHAYLRRLGIANELEWFQIGGAESHKHFNDFRQNRGVLKKLTATPYNLRGEQVQAISKTLNYLRGHAGGEFLWNAKPRFGKTLATYDLCKRANAQSVLIVTNRPAIANSWYKDYVKFFGGDTWLFVSDVDALKGKPYVLSRADLPKDTPYIEFVSLQDLKGSVYFGGKIDKLAELTDDNGWDILVVDEAHEGIDTTKTAVAFDRIKRRFTLYLSGTPFKALANNKFSSDAIFNWTYADEQDRKASWTDTETENPYAELPGLNLYTYQMSEIVRDEIQRGIELDGTSIEYAFDLNEFFATADNGKFEYDSSVDKFLDALTTQKKFPFSTPELREELRHTFWILNRVDSAKALANKLKAHPVFKSYKVILAAGDGKLDDDDANQKSFDKVVKAIAKHERTITLSVGQLTTGVTIPEWTGVLMLANMHSPALYVQAAFRAQNPCMFKRGGKYLRKENAYVFDFDPARTLTIYEAFANDLADNTGGGRGDSDTRKANVRKLLNFFPVIGEDEGGELIELDAEKVLSIPRKIRAVEVVERGFQSDFLFQNISRVFNATAEVIDIIAKLPAVSTENFQSEVRHAKETLYLDNDGEIALPADYVIGQAVELFGEKIYSVEGDTARAVKEGLNAQIKSTLDTAQISYGKDLTASERKKLEKQLKTAADTLVDRAFKNHAIDKKTVADKTTLTAAFQEKLAEQINEFMKTAEETVVERVETAIQERDKKPVEDDVRDRLRGFSRTIPAFLMAYGEIDNPATLATFDKIIPDDVFQELTGITLDEFRYLRDVGKLFEPVTFDDAVKEFLNLRGTLADYFDETHTKDIFDYIPPQRTNQIFTPKETVRHMCDLLEAESPGCFDDPNKKFFDLYMKSGLFVAEIVKRLYRSPKLKALFPTKAERLRHIFIAQVYGLAPTEIIYRIATNYILGCGIDIDTHNLRKANALDAAKADKLNELLEENFIMINFDASPLRDVLPILKRGLKIDTLPTPRALKSDAEKLLRTRTNAEVFTPSHVVKYMVDALDDGQIDSRWLEIACGEAPFITNRYDAESGEDIPTADRAGILDRKLRLAKNFDEASHAVQSVYGYDIQADSLLIARANVLLTFAEYVKDFSTAELKDIAEIIRSNFWHFDALNPPPRQINLFDDVTDWNSGDSFLVSGDKFDFVIGNPPYQDETENNGRQPPVYDKFMEAAYKISEKTVLITPARFLFNQGGTTKDFNQRMLSDPHLKVLEYEPDASKYFKGVDIKGGVAITLHDETQNFGAIGTFTKYGEINYIQRKVCVDNPNFCPLNKIIHTPIAYKLSDKFFTEHPELICKLYKPDDNALRTNIFERLAGIFFDAKPDDGNDYIQVLGLSNSKRIYKWIRRDYVTAPSLIDKHKVFIPESNGAGTFGEELSSPLIGEPAQGCTQTFITVGAFDTAAEAEACLSYIKSKFARVMLGILKVTQHNPPATWAKVPMQDFNPATSDIDWSGDIDAQLYRKYGLDATEIEFIETHVKAMT